jgi:transposase
VAEVGSEALARDPEMRALRAANKRLAQELEILKKPSSVACYKRRLSATPPTP